MSSSLQPKVRLLPSPNLLPELNFLFVPSAASSIKIHDSQGDADPVNSQPQAPAKPSAPPTDAFVPINIIKHFASKVKSLPKSVATAKKDHPLSAYSGSCTPEKHTAGIADEDLWPHFNRPLINLIPTGDHNTQKHLVLRGKYGLDGFLKFIQHLAYSHKMDTAVLEPKLECLMGIMDLIVATKGKAPEQSAAVKPPKKCKNDPSTSTNTAPAKKSKAPLEIPDLVSPMCIILFFTSVCRNENLPESDFMSAWEDLKTSQKEKVKKFQELSQKKNAGAGRKKIGSGRKSASAGQNTEITAEQINEAGGLKDVSV
ncbi:hypothetical protein AAF712_013436 [Marasmius tenuissimus]|uniref:Uncharacterized protein n=1 Tax=Marasmius tenuissimus TaxID=585030 RepID=A0ABR2ZEV6_9AGAR